MKRYPAARPPVRVPAFLPVPVRPRADGWTPLRQARFIGYLAVTGSVSLAARKVAMSRESAYRLREHRGAESFAAAWDAALGLARPEQKVTPLEASIEADFIRLRPIVRRGKVLGVAEKHDNSALLKLLRQLARAEARTRQARESHARKMQGSVQSACPLPPVPPR